MDQSSSLGGRERGGDKGVVRGLFRNEEMQKDHDSYTISWEGPPAHGESQIQSNVT